MLKEMIFKNHKPRSDKKLLTQKTLSPTPVGQRN